jgi:hypothetical protein
MKFLRPVGETIGALTHRRSETWTGIAPASVPGFLAAQLAGALIGAALWGWLFAADARPAG